MFGPDRHMPDPTVGIVDVKDFPEPQLEQRLPPALVGQTVMIAPERYPIGRRVDLGMDPSPRLH